MKATKALYISQEIQPYLASSPMADYCRFLPQAVQELGGEVRTFMPKYGCINERRNMLHEVIRLSGVNIPIDDNDYPLIIKVATLQPSRLQVYFIDNDDFFFHHASHALEIDEHPEDNDERIIFFSLGVLETVKKLRWYPAIIQCTGWATALAPLLIKTKYAEDPAVKDSKVVYALFDNSFDGTLDPRMMDKIKQLGIDDEALASIANGPVDYIALNKLAIDHADAIVQATEGVPAELIDYAKASGKPFLPFVADDYKGAYADFYNSLIEA